MAVQLTSNASGLSPLTSPPKHPDPKPSSSIVSAKKDYGDRSILITYPFPDTIELVTDVENALLMTPYATGGSVKKVYGAIDRDLRKWIEGYKTGETVFSPSPKVKGGSQPSAIFTIAYDDNQPLHIARLTLSRRPGPDFGIWSVRLEFSPSKAGPTGLVKLIARLDEALPLQIPKLIGSFRISRIDAAIDLIGALPLDLIAHIPKPGKRMVFVGDDGSPESVYHYQKKPLPKNPPQYLAKKTTGPLRLKLYERRKYCLQLGISPPYGDCPVTRVETERRWTKISQRPHLSELAEIKNQFSGRRVAYAAAIPANKNLASAKGWAQYCLAAFGGGASKAQLKSSVVAGLKYRRSYDGCAGDLVDENAWLGWGKGIAMTGLDEWVELAGKNMPKP